MGGLSMFYPALSHSRKKKADLFKRFFQPVLDGSINADALDQMQVFINDSVAIKNNIAYLYYTGNGQGTPTWDVDLIFCASKNLLTGNINEGWQRYTNGTSNAVVVVGNTATWKNLQVFVRTVIYDADMNLFRMWYGGHRNTAQPFCIGYATSTDGFTWSDFGANPIVTNFVDVGSIGVIGFSVYKETTTLYHALASGDGNIKEVGAMYMTSTNGTSWTKVRTGLFIGMDVRFINAIRKINGLYYVWVNYGYNLNYYVNGLPLSIRVYSTADFITFTLVGEQLNPIEPDEAGFLGGAVINYNSKWYTFYTYYKNQVKYNGNNGEPFTSLKVLESPLPFSEAPNYKIQYPPYVKRYYPCYQFPESQTPKERLLEITPTVTGTLAWVKMRYVNFSGSQKLSYADNPYSGNDLAVKARINRNLTGVHPIANQDSVVRGWYMNLNNGKLEVGISGNGLTIEKLYRSVNNVVKPTGIYDENEHMDVGFIFREGVLRLLIGNSLGVPVTLVSDSPVSLLYNSVNALTIGEHLGVYSSNQTRSVCILSGASDSELILLDL